MHRAAARRSAAPVLGEGTASIGDAGAGAGAGGESDGEVADETCPLAAMNEQNMKMITKKMMIM